MRRSPGDHHPCPGRTALWGTLLLLALGGAGCPDKNKHDGKEAASAGSKPEARQVVVATLTVRQVSPPRLRLGAVSDEQALALVRRPLEQAEAVVLAARSASEGEGEGAYRVSGQWGVVPNPDDPVLGDPVLVVALVAKAPLLAGLPPLRVDLLARPRGDLEGEEVAEQARAALTAAGGDLAQQLELVRAPPARLVAALEPRKGASQTLLLAALEIAAHRRLAEAVEPAIALLRHSDPAVADRAVGALVAIGDRRAVRPITEAVRFEDTARLAKILDGVAALGGIEAREYLQFVASGHEDADIRSLAREALERMKRGGEGK